MDNFGVFGGTFDPPHIGHLILATEAKVQLNLTRVLWVLTPNPPHKLNHIITDAAMRQELVLAAIQNEPAFEFCRVDIDRDPPHYAVDTMQILRHRYPASNFTYLMGEDSLIDLPNWHQPEAFIGLCSYLGVMRRSGTQTNQELLDTFSPEVLRKIRFIDVPLFQISSSDIRRRIAEGLPVRYYLTEKVFEVIEVQNLYRCHN